MARGIIYVMTTVVPGLIKIGKTETNRYKNRMSELERNGYSNVTGLSRRYAIEVEDYGEKEKLLHEIFSKSQVEDTELFALDVDMVVQLLSSFEGNQIFPPTISKEEVFDEAVVNQQKTLIPDGIYTFASHRKGEKIPNAKLVVEDGIYAVKKGSEVCLAESDSAKGIRKKAKIAKGKLTEDIVCNSVSTAAILIIGRSCNGWTSWKDKNGQYIDIYRRKNDDNE